MSITLQNWDAKTYYKIKLIVGNVSKMSRKGFVLKLTYNSQKDYRIGPPLYIIKCNSLLGILVTFYPEIDIKARKKD